VKLEMYKKIAVKDLKMDLMDLVIDGRIILKLILEK
jgi:hypothetical protein